MFIQIVKGDRALMIPAGAFRQYASAGWQRAEENEAHSDKGKNTQPESQKQDLDTNSQPEEDNLGGEPEVTPKEAFIPEPEKDEEDEDVEYVDPEELLEKPIGDLDFEELQIVAEYLGLDVENLTTLKALRKAIKAAQE